MICTCGIFPLVSKACRDLANIEARIKFLREKFSNGGPSVVLAAMRKHSNTSPVTLSLALSRGSSPNKPSLRRARYRESRGRQDARGYDWQCCNWIGDLVFTDQKVLGPRNRSMFTRRPFPLWVGGGWSRDKGAPGRGRIRSRAAIFR